MSTLSALQRRVDDVVERADTLLVERLRREQAELEHADAAQRRADAAKAREDAERKRQIQATYADAFVALGSEVPLPLDDERPVDFRDRLFDRLRRRFATEPRMGGYACRWWYAGDERHRTAFARRRTAGRRAAKH